MLLLLLKNRPDKMLKRPSSAKKRKKEESNAKESKKNSEINKKPKQDSERRKLGLREKRSLRLERQLVLRRRPPKLLESLLKPREGSERPLKRCKKLTREIRRLEESSGRNRIEKKESAKKRNLKPKKLDSLRSKDWLGRPKKERDRPSLRLLSRIVNSKKWRNKNKKRDRPSKNKSKRSKLLRPNSEMRDVRLRQIWSVPRLRPKRKLHSESKKRLKRNSRRPSRIETASSPKRQLSKHTSKNRDTRPNSLQRPKPRQLPLKRRPRRRRLTMRRWPKTKGRESKPK